MLTVFKRILKSGIVNFKRQFTLNSATIFVLTIGIMMLTSVFFIDGLYNHLYQIIQGRVGISVYFNPEVSTDDILRLQKDLKERPDVYDVVYISKEDALVKFKEKHAYDESIIKTLEIIDGNPLLASIRVVAKNDKAIIPTGKNPYDDIAKFLKGDKYSPMIRQMSYYETENIISTLINTTKEIKIIGFVSSLIFVIIVILMVFSTVRLTVRGFKEEINVMKLVGASNWFVRGPFMVGGFICGILSVILSLILVANISYFATPKMITLTAGFNPFVYFTNNFWLILLMQLFVGIGIAIIANAMAVKRYLKV
jgi:cell division transport system permease protein